MRRSMIGLSTLVALAISASVASAQTQRAPGGRAGNPEARADLREKLKGMSAEERKAAIEKAKDRREAAKNGATDEQKAYRAALQAELKATHDAVKAGTLTRETAAAQLKAWREANPRPKKS